MEVKEKYLKKWLGFFIKTSSFFSHGVCISIYIQSLHNPRTQWPISISLEGRERSLKKDYSPVTFIKIVFSVEKTQIIALCKAKCYCANQL